MVWGVGQENQTEALREELLQASDLLGLSWSTLLSPQAPRLLSLLHCVFFQRD